MVVRSGWSVGEFGSGMRRWRLEEDERGGKLPGGNDCVPALVID